MFICYEGHNETIVCSEDNELAAVQDYFNLGGRDIDDYDRIIRTEPFMIQAKLRVD